MVSVKNLLTRPCTSLFFNCRSDDAQSDSSTVTVLFTNGEQMEVERAAVTVQKGRSPIDAWPDAFIFFDRYVRAYVRYTISV